MSYQSIINTMRVGFMAYNYPIPEGVSEPDKMEWVHRRAAELGCDCLQGFAIARPMPADAMLAWASARMAVTSE